MCCAPLGTLVTPHVVAPSFCSVQFFGVLFLFLFSFFGFCFFDPEFFSSGLLPVEAEEQNWLGPDSRVLGFPTKWKGCWHL